MRTAPTKTVSQAKTVDCIRSLPASREQPRPACASTHFVQPDISEAPTPAALGQIGVQNTPHNSTYALCAQRPGRLCIPNSPPAPKKRPYDASRTSSKAANPLEFHIPRSVTGRNINYQEGVPASAGLMMATADRPIVKSIRAAGPRRGGTRIAWVGQFVLR